MKQIATYCIILKSTVVREIDKLLTLFSPDIGIFYVTAYGACKSKNRFGGKLEPLSVIFSELTVKTVGTESEYGFKEVTLHDYFENLTGSYETVMTAQSFCEILLKNNTAGEDRKLFALLYQALKALNENSRLGSRIFINFLIRYLAYMGFAAPIGECGSCGHVFSENETVCIQRSDYQAYCRNCAEGDCVPMESSLKNYFNCILKLKFRESIRIPININEERKLKAYLISQLQDISGFHYKTLESFR